MSDAGLPLVCRQATSADAPDMSPLERAAQALLVGQGVHLHDVAVPDGVDEPTTWTLVLVAELVAKAARALGYTEITGTTFRDVAFNGPFYESLGCAEDPRPHPVMVERREVERAVGLDRFGARVVLRLTL